MAYGGHPFQNSATPLVVEYLERKKLAKLGITTRTAKVSAYKIDCFLMIDSEFETLRRRDAPRPGKK